MFERNTYLYILLNNLFDRKTFENRKIFGFMTTYLPFTFISPLYTETCLKTQRTHLNLGLLQKALKTLYYTCLIAV